jgi:hypothetical protein
VVENRDVRRRIEFHHDIDATVRTRIAARANRTTPRG